MIRPWLFGLFIGTAAWLLVRRGVSSSRRVVPVDQAADRLRRAWSDHHTVA